MWYSPQVSYFFTDRSQVRGTGKTFDTLGPSIYAELAELQTSSKIYPPSQHDSVSSVYFDKIGRVEKTPVYVLTSLPVGTLVSGPAVVIDDTQTILVTPEARAVVTTRGLCISLELGDGGAEKL
jgi:5-oxoprolinase (ATP-hydrolysing)